ncbi:MAG: hypothetical protein ACRDPW_09485, partial [Mycobacteriales bacterium]
AVGIVEVNSDYAQASSVTAAVADCARLERYLAVGSGPQTAFPNGCQENTAYWAPSVPPQGRSLLGVSSLPEAASALTDDTAPQAVMNDLGFIDALITLPSTTVLEVARQRPAAEPAAVDSTSASTTYSDSFRLTLRASRDSVNDTLALVHTVAPYNQPSAFGLDPDSGQNIAMINGYIRLGLIGGAAMALLALLAALADRVTERRRADHELLAVGAPAALVRRIHLWEVSLTLAAALSTAATAGILGGLAWQLAGGLVRTPDWGAIITLLVVVTAVGALAAYVTAVLAPRRLDVTTLRQE